MIPQSFIDDMKRHATNLSATEVVKLMELHNSTEKAKPAKKETPTPTDEEIKKAVDQMFIGL